MSQADGWLAYQKAPREKWAQKWETEKDWLKTENNRWFALSKCEVDIELLR